VLSGSTTQKLGWMDEVDVTVNESVNGWRGR
jgi:hypothetical protein